MVEHRLEKSKVVFVGVLVVHLRQSEKDEKSCWTEGCCSGGQDQSARERTSSVKKSRTKYVMNEK